MLLEHFTDKYGITMALDPGLNVAELTRTRCFYDDEGVLRLSERLLKPGMTVIDVGANLGQFTLFAASRVGPTGSVHAFEPAAQTCQALAENLELNRHGMPPVRVNRAAVADRSGTLDFHVYPREYSVWNSIHPHPMKLYADGRLTTVLPTQTERVPVVTIDGYCDERGIGYVDLLKVDVEGWEASVFDGSARLFAAGRCPHLLFEISLEPLAGTPFTAADVLACADRHGFDLFRILSDGGLEPVDPARFKAPPFANYYGRRRAA